jgi:hypothetical protein
MLKKCSLSLAIKEMQIKTPLSIDFTPVRIASINKTTTNKCCKECREKETLLHCCWECSLVQRLWKKIWRLPKKLKIDLPYDQAILLLGIYAKNVT